MKPTAVDRYTFTADEVLAAILPNVTYRREFELRIDADGYVVIDIVRQPAQTGAGVVEVQDDETPPPPLSDQPEQPSVRPQGEAEQEARALCTLPIFRAFLEVKTEEAALRILPPGTMPR